MAPYVAALRRWWPLAVAIVAIAGLAGLAVAKARPTSYTATAKVLLGQQRQVDLLLGSTDYTPDPERELNTSLQLITLAPIAQSVSDSLRLHEPAAAIAARVSTAVDRNSNIVAISARDADPDRAAAIANAFAAGYRDYRAQAAGAALHDAITAAELRMPDLASATARAALRRQLTRLEAAEPLQTGGVQVVAAATAAGATRHPRPMLTALLAGFLGLIVAAVALAVLARTDQRVAGDRELENVTGRPVVARISRSPQLAADAAASLALWLTRRKDGGVVLATSSGPEEGSVEVAVGLARALGLIGRSAIAIDADLRTPRFTGGLGVPGAGGLAAILSGTATLEDELTTIGAGAAVLAAGTTSEMPQALLAGARMKALVQEACARAEFVVIAGVAGDSIALAGLADDVLVVARDDVTRRDELARAMRALAAADLTPAGVVATARPSRRLFGTGTRRRVSAAPSAGVTTATSEVTVG